MIQTIHPDSSLLDSLVNYSHGAVTHADIRAMLEGGVGTVVRINGRLICGICWNVDAVSFFGFHGVLEMQDIHELVAYASTIGKREHISKIQFLSPRRAWMRLLEALAFQPVMYVYEKEI